MKNLLSKLSTIKEETEEDIIKYDEIAREEDIKFVYENNKYFVINKESEYNYINFCDFFYFCCCCCFYKCLQERM